MSSFILVAVQVSITATTRCVPVWPRVRLWCPCRSTRRSAPWRTRRTYSFPRTCLPSTAAPMVNHIYDPSSCYYVLHSKKETHIFPYMLFETGGDYSIYLLKIHKMTLGNEKWTEISSK